MKKKLGYDSGLRLLFIAGLAIGLMFSLRLELAHAQGCFEVEDGVCISPSSGDTSDPGDGFSSQGFGDILAFFTPPGSGLPIGLENNGSGDLYLTEIATDEVHLMDVSGTPISSFSYLPNTGNGLGVTFDGTHIYLTDTVDDDVDIYTPAGVYVSSFSVAAQTFFPEGITYNPSTGNLYMVDADSFGSDNVFEYTTTGTLVNTFPLASNGNDGIAFDPIRCTYWIYDGGPTGSDTITHYSSTFTVIESFPGTGSTAFTQGEGVGVIGDVLYVSYAEENEIVTFDLIGANASFLDTCNEPTAIDLASFEVEANNGQALVIWETATEIDNAGFNIYRASSSDGPWVQVNSALIAAEGDPVSGAQYTFADTPGRGTFYYHLEDIDFFGLSSLHEPALVEMGAVIRIPWFRPSLPPF